jgi:succinoglycan biosynthesis transport protein ExoP
LVQYDINLREYWRILKKRKFTVALITVTLGFFTTFFAILRAPTLLYETNCIIEIQKAPVLTEFQANAMALSDSDDIQTQMTVIKSYDVFQKVAERMGLIRRGQVQGDKRLRSNVIPIIEGLQSKVEVTRQKYSSILEIKVTDPSPAFAQRLANTVALTYREFHAEQQTKRASDSLKYIEEQQREVREKLREAEEDFNKYTKENELISIDLQSDKLVARTQEIQREIRKLDDEKAELQELLRRVNAFIANPSGPERDFYSTKANSRYQNANDALVAFLLKRDTLLKEYTPKHPEVVAISHEITENASKMALILQEQMKNIDSQKLDLSKEAESIDNKTKVLLDKNLEYNRLKRKVGLYTDMITLLERKNQEAMIQRSEKPEVVNIVKPALLPTEPINRPYRAMDGAMGMFIGLLVGLVVAFVIETFDTSLGAIEDVEQTLGTQVIGVIPQIDTGHVEDGLSEKFASEPTPHARRRAVNLVCHYAPKSMAAESFRALRANIDFKSGEKKLITMLITSASPQEGKTLVAGNLALAMAQAGKKTLLVGSDLRKPSLGKIFGVEPSPGLTDILLGNYHWYDTVRTVVDLVLGDMGFTEIMASPRLDNLHLITSGSIPSEPAELIGSARLGDFIAEAKKEYEVILFDAPPILSAADAVIIGTKVDGVFLVYRLGTVSRGLLRRACSQLEQVKSHIVGVILNGMRPEVSPDFEDYKQYKYYHSYGEEGKSARRRETEPAFSFMTPVQKTFVGIKKILEPGKSKTRRTEKRKHRRSLTMSLILVACASLGLGLLYNNRMIDPFGVSATEKPNKKAALRLPIRQKKSETLHPAKTVPAEPIGSQSKSTGENSVADAILRVPEKPPTIPAVDSKIDGQVQGKIPSETKARETAQQITESSQPALPKPQASRTASPPATAAALGPPSTPKIPNPDLPATTEDPGMYSYSLYLGSVPNLGLAKKAELEYRKKGLDPYYVKVLLSKGEWYRIYAGYFKNHEQGESLIAENRFRGAEVAETPWANLIGIYASTREREERMRVLQKLDYSPYVVKDPDGKERLYVGAFYPKKRAERLYEELMKKGIENKIVKR